MPGSIEAWLAVYERCVAPYHEGDAKSEPNYRHLRHGPGAAK